METRDDKVRLLASSIKSFPDFPKPGIIFRDIFSILGDPQTAAILYDIIASDCKHLQDKVTAVCGLDSRGFLFGPQIAHQLNVPFVPIRKGGKLPGPVISTKFELEYGSDEFQVQSEFLKGGNVLLVDDLLATGGSLKAAGKLVEQLGCKVLQCFVIMELAELNGRKNISYDVHSIMCF